MLDREVALGDPVALELFVDQLAEGVHPDLVDEDLDAGAGAVHAQPVLAVEDAKDGLGDLQVVAVVELDELVKSGGDARHDRGAAADPDLDAAHAVALARDEADVVDAGDRNVLVGRGEGGLDLPRHELRRGVADEVAHVRAGVGGDVEELARRDSRERVARHVADRVAASLAGRQARIGDDADELGGVRERDVVDLDVLPGRDVPLVERRPLLDRIGEGFHLLRGHAAHRQLHADHLDVGLALAVDALLKAEADELLLGLLSVQEALRLGVEVVELALDDRDQVPGDVVVDLRVLERAQASLALLFLALLLVELVRGGLVLYAHGCSCGLHRASYYTNPNPDLGF